jgi:hypothetical protein
VHSSSAVLADVPGACFLAGSRPCRLQRCMQGLQIVCFPSLHVLACTHCNSAVCRGRSRLVATVTFEDAATCCCADGGLSKPSLPPSGC